MRLSTAIVAFRDRTTAATRRVDWLPPLLIRLVLGVTFLLTGWGKLHNLDDVIKFFDSLGIPAAHLQAPFVASVEFVGGILLLGGLGTRVVATFLTAVMAVAIYTAIWPKAEGFTDVLGSIESIYLVSLVYLAVHGAGAVSVDHLVVHHASKE